MPSLKSKIFNFLIRNRHLFQGKLKKEKFDFNTSIEDFREQCERSAAKYSTVPEGVDISFRAGKGMIHCYPLLAPMFKEATEAMEEICEFINDHI